MADHAPVTIAELQQMQLQIQQQFQQQLQQQFQQLRQEITQLYVLCLVCSVYWLQPDKWLCPAEKAGYKQGWPNHLPAPSSSAGRSWTPTLAGPGNS